MAMKKYDRREFIKLVGAAGAVSATGLLWGGNVFAGASGKVVVVGAGFGGATCANYLKRWSPDIDVTVIERDTQFITCPFSNEVIGGDLEIDAITHSYEGLKGRGVKIVHDEVTGLDTAAKKVSLKGGDSVAYDMLVLSPGISFKWGAVKNDKEATSKAMPHAWQAGEQTLMLRDQLRAMKDGGTVIIVPPPKPFRCPPGPYERASLIAHYLKVNKPKSKILIVDSNESHSKQAAFQEGWKALYGYGPDGMIEWVKGTEGGQVESVDIANMSVTSAFGETYKGDVINLIPHQHANNLVHEAGLTNSDGWCDVNQGTFESKKAKDVFVLGDACVAGAMPKSGHSAASQAKNCAAVIVSRMAGSEPPAPTYANTCYSLIAPSYGISVAAVYQLKEEGITNVSGGVSPLEQDDRFRSKEAKYARAWYKSITADMFG